MCPDFSRAHPKGAYSGRICQAQGSRGKNVRVRDDLVLFHARDVLVVSKTVGELAECWLT
jgi:hypothetical protein